MNTFNDAVLKNLPFSNRVLNLALDVCSKSNISLGSDSINLTSQTSHLQQMYKSACFDSITAINSLCNFKISKTRLVSLLEGARPVTEKEFIIVGYHGNLELIYRFSRVIEINPQVIDQIRFTLDQRSSRPDKLVKKDYDHKMLSPEEKNSVLAQLIKDYCEQIKVGKYNSLLLIALFIVNYVQLECLDNHIELVTLLVLRLLLCNCGQEALYYVSLEQKILNNYNQYQLALKNAVEQPQNTEFLLNWVEYLFELIVDANYSMQENWRHAQQEKNLRKENTLQALSSMHREFTTKELQNKVGYIAASVVRQVLKEQAEQGKLICKKVGRSIIWRQTKVTEGDEKQGSLSTKVRAVRKGDKSRSVIEAILHINGQFCFDDLRNLCKGVSEVTIRKVIDKQRRLGAIICRKRGRSSFWEKVPPTSY